MQVGAAQTAGGHPEQDLTDVGDRSATAHLDER
jgi:hypothetical protein